MQKKASFLAFILAFSTALPLSLPQAQAQLVQLGQTLTMSAAIRAQAHSLARRRRRSGVRSGYGARAVRHTVRQSTTRFRPSTAVRQRDLKQFVANIRQTSPQDAASLQHSFAKGDPIAAIAPGLRRYHLRTDDVADAATAYLIAAWYGVRGRNDDPPLVYVRGVRAQMRDVMLAVPAFVSASDAAKQQMAEALLVQTLIADALITQAKGKPTQMAKVRATIQQGVLQSFQLDLATLKLTNQGLQP